MVDSWQYILSSGTFLAVVHSWKYIISNGTFLAVVHYWQYIHSSDTLYMHAHGKSISISKKSNLFIKIRGGSTTESSPFTEVIDTNMDRLSNTCA